MDQEAVDLKLLTVEEAASILRISKPTMYRLTANRKIPHYKAGARILFSEEHIREYLSQHTVSAETRSIN